MTSMRFETDLSQFLRAFLSTLTQRLRNIRAQLDIKLMGKETEEAFVRN